MSWFKPILASVAILANLASVAESSGLPESSVAYLLDNRPGNVRLTQLDGPVVGTFFATDVFGGDLAIDSAGSIYVLTVSGGDQPTIRRYGETGALEDVIKLPGLEEAFPDSIAIGPGDRVYLFERFKRDTQARVRSLNGNVVLSFELYDADPGKLEIDSIGNFYLLTYPGLGEPTLRKYGSGGDLRAIVELPRDPFYVEAFAIGPNDDIYILEANSNSGGRVRVLHGSAVAVFALEDYDKGYLAIGRDGDFFIAFSGGKEGPTTVRRYNVSGVLETLSELRGIFPYAMAATRFNSQTTPGTPRCPATATVTPNLPIPCVGDCDRDGIVELNELVRGVSIALGTATLDVCPEFNCSGNARLTVGCLVKAVNAALYGCGGQP